jgi:parallel beta-helix repeat protein
MYRMTFPRLALLIATTAIALALAAPAQAATRSVCSACTYTTIQGAVDASNPGDVIDVASGVYTESVQILAPHNDITILGEQAGVDARNGRPGALETIVEPDAVPAHAGRAFNIQTDGITIDGVTVRSGAAGIWTQDVTSGHYFVNNIFHDNSIGVYPNVDGGRLTRIRHNLFRQNNLGMGATPPAAGAGNGIYADAGTYDLTVDENRFAGNLNASIFLAHVPAGAPNRDIRILDNVSTTDTTTGPPTPNGPAAYIVQSRDVLIQGNTSTDSYMAGFYLENDVNVILRDNTVVNPGDDYTSIRIGISNLLGPSQGIEAIGNTLLGGAQGANWALKVSDGATNGPVEFHFNRVVGNEHGVENQDLNAGDRVNAQHNWWGKNTGPNTAGADPATGNVLFDPWLVLGIGASPTLIPPDGTSTSAITADLRHDSNGDPTGPNDFPDGTSIGFATTLGTLQFASRATFAGAAPNTLKSSTTPGTATVSGTLDNQTVSTPVTFGSPPQGPQGNPGPQGNQGLPGPRGPSGVIALPAFRILKVNSAGSFPRRLFLRGFQVCATPSHAASLRFELSAPSGPLGVRNRALGTGERCVGFVPNPRGLTLGVFTVRVRVIARRGSLRASRDRFILIRR